MEIQELKNIMTEIRKTKPVHGFNGISDPTEEKISEIEYEEKSYL